jgi:hypothetical protein
MRQIGDYKLWIGHTGDANNQRLLLDAGIEALIDLANNEPAVAVHRELLYCRFPILDGAGNPTWLLQTAVNTVSRLLIDEVPTIVCCSLGMSRSPAIVAGAIATAFKLPLVDCLNLVCGTGPHDLSGGLWRDLRQMIGSPIPIVENKSLDSKSKSA